MRETIPLLDTDLAGPEAPRRKGRPVGGWPQTAEQMERSRVRKKLHAVGHQHGLVHEDLSELIDLSLAIAPIAEMEYLIEQIPIWAAAAEASGEDAVCGGLITYMEGAKTAWEVAQSWKLYSRLIEKWNPLIQLQAKKAKEKSLQRVGK